MKEINEQIEFKNAKYIPFVLGVMDRNVKTIERELNVNITLRNEKLFIQGNENKVKKAKEVIRNIERLADKHYNFSLTDLIYSVKSKRKDFLKDLPNTVILKDKKGREVAPKTFGQRKYIESIFKNTITFAVGPAGTGKTYLSVAVAVQYLLSEQVNRIVLTRPVIEAGENLGFLPGDIQQKVDPYFRPIYDALYSFLGQEKTVNLLENKTIEIAPLAYMRGRTLNDAFIILDEAQNTTFLQMKMFLTRLGEGSRMVITGDITQSDLLLSHGEDGLQAATKLLKDIKGISFIYLTMEDVVRHKLVQQIINAYEKGNKNVKKKK